MRIYEGAGFLQIRLSFMRSAERSQRTAKRSLSSLPYKSAKNSTLCWPTRHGRLSLTRFAEASVTCRRECGSGDFDCGQHDDSRD